MIGLANQTAKNFVASDMLFEGLVNAQRTALGAVQSAIILTTALGPSRLIALHGSGKIEHSGPFPVWLRRLADLYRGSDDILQVSAQDTNALEGWNRFAAPFLLRLPLTHSWWGTQSWYLFKSEPCTPAEVERAQTIARAASAALALEKPASLPRKRWIIRSLVSAGVLALCLFPVRLSTIAPAEIVAADPQLIASSFPAVVKRILVSPNEAVEKDQIIVELDDADQHARLQIAKREYEVAVAELRRLTQLGFQDPASRNRLSEMQGQVAIKQLMVQRSELELERTKLRAPMPGVAIVSDPVDWSGRPVQTGEKIMAVANPALTRVRLWIPAKDGSLLKQGLKGELYLDSNPWQGRSVTLESWSYEAELSPAGVIAFRALAEQTGTTARSMLLGLHGTVHLAGDSVPLILYLLRRPIIYVRQLLVL